MERLFKKIKKLESRNQIAKFLYFGIYDRRDLRIKRLFFLEESPLIDN